MLKMVMGEGSARKKDERENEKTGLAGLRNIGGGKTCMDVVRQVKRDSD